MSLQHRGEYPPDWKAISIRVRMEADYRCIRCGHFHDVSVVPWSCDDRCTHPNDGKQRVLTVHHLNGDKSNCLWWNLLALCQLCHLQIQAKVEPEQAYLWEHSDWFKPYAAGFYAWQIGLNVTRQQVMETPGLITYLLKIGQPHLSHE